jgi:LysM repeat protein
MRRLFWVLVCLITILLIGLPVKEGIAQAGDPWALISEVNALRASYGLQPYKINNALMSSAQTHSNYMLDIGSVTHSGPGGSRPHDRAVAAGYGGGALVYISENIAMGINLSPQQAVYNMWQDALHLETMISSRYTDIGAGVAVSGDRVYYTIDVGYVAGSPGNSSSPPSSNTTQPPTGSTGPTPVYIEPVVVSTPNPDGSIIHIVGSGQSLWNIAAVYEIPLSDLLALNGLSENTFIHPGDKLIIKPATTATTTLETTEAVTLTLTVTPTGSPTPSPTTKPPTLTPVVLSETAESPLIIVEGSPSKTQSSEAAVEQLSTSEVMGKNRPDYLLVAIAVIGLAGLALVIVGSLSKQSPP